MTEDIHLGPQFPQQTRFLGSTADFALYGGGAGGGKSSALVLDALHFIEKPGFRGVIFRRKSKDHAMGGGILDEARKFWTACDDYRHRAAFRLAPAKEAEWPSGAKVQLQYPETGLNYEQQFQGLQAAWAAFDEATHFDWGFVSYIHGRLRSDVPGIGVSIRMSCNPDPDHWLAAWVAWYLDVDGYPDMNRSGMRRWWARERDGDELVWGDSPEEVMGLTGRPRDQAFSFEFYPALASDNPFVESSYAARVATTRVREEQLGKGNWHVRPDMSGMLAESLWRPVQPSDVPRLDWRVRCWDRASTKPRGLGHDPDYTASVLMGGTRDGKFWVGLGDRGVTAMRDIPGEVIKHMKMTAIMDGPSVIQSIPIDPANAGQESMAWTKSKMRDPRIGRLDFWTQRHNKVVRATPLSDALSQGLGHLVLDSWTRQPYKDPGRPKTTLLNLWWEHVNPFPDGVHDDLADGAAGAYHAGAKGGAFSGGTKKTHDEINRLLTRGARRR